MTAPATDLQLMSKTFQKQLHPQYSTVTSMTTEINLMDGFSAPAIDLQLMSNSVSGVFHRFDQCISMSSKNEVIAKALVDIEKQRTEFHFLSNQSIGQVEILKGHSKNVLSYVVCLKRPDSSLEHVIFALRKLLNEARRNKNSFQNLKAAFEKVKENLVEKKYKLKEYKPKLDKQEKIRKQKNRELTNKQSGHKKIYAHLFTLLTVMFFGFLFVPELRPIGSFSAVFAVLAVSFFGFGEWDAARVAQLREEVEELDEVLNNSVENIDGLTENLDPIVRCMNQFETFWSHEESRAESLIDQLEHTLDSDEGPFDEIRRSLVSEPIEMGWNDVQKQCDTYKAIVSRLLGEAPI